MEMITLLTFWTISVSNSLVSAQGTAICDATETTFRKECEEKKGVAVDNRCYFVIDTTCNWKEAWQLCSNVGGTLAQFHTTSDYDTVQTCLSFRSIDGTGIGSNNRSAWIALQKDNQETNLDSGLSDAYWYSSVDQKLLPMQDTYLDHYPPVDKAEGTEGCCAVSIAPMPSDGVVDNHCISSLNVPLCQLQNMYEEYTKTDVCVAQGVLDTQQVKTGDECATLCAANVNCRSINLYTDTLTCELTSWLQEDAPRSKATETCVHYEPGVDYIAKFRPVTEVLTNQAEDPNLYK